MVGKRGKRSIIESLWTAGAVAFVTHGLMISAFALGMACFKGGAQPALANHFVVEMVFADGNGQKGREAHVTPMVAAHQGMPLKNSSMEKPVPGRHVHFTPSSHGEEAGRKAAGEGGEAHPCPVYNPPPVYPLKARRRKIQGIVLVRLFLAETGEVSEALPLPPRVGPVLEEAALAAVYKWRFKPGVKMVEVPIEFRLVA